MAQQKIESKVIPAEAQHCNVHAYIRYYTKIHESITSLMEIVSNLYHEEFSGLDYFDIKIDNDMYEENDMRNSYYEYPVFLKELKRLKDYLLNGIRLFSDIHSSLRYLEQLIQSLKKSNQILPNLVRIKNTADTDYIFSIIEIRVTDLILRDGEDTIAALIGDALSQSLTKRLACVGFVPDFFVIDEYDASRTNKFAEWLTKVREIINAPRVDCQTIFTIRDNLGSQDIRGTFHSINNELAAILDWIKDNVEVYKKFNENADGRKNNFQAICKAYKESYNKTKSSIQGRELCNDTVQITAKIAARAATTQLIESLNSKISIEEIADFCDDFMS